jgi:hypothetical protein
MDSGISSGDRAVTAAIPDRQFLRQYPDCDLCGFDPARNGNDESSSGVNTAARWVV